MITWHVWEGVELGWLYAGTCPLSQLFTQQLQDILPYTVTDIIIGNEAVTFT